MINIFIPMMGKGSRFIREGFTVPKYLIDIHNKPLLYYVLYGFRHLFHSSSFTLIARTDHDSHLIENILNELLIPNFEIISLDGDTKGQASSVYQALEHTRFEIKNLLVFNIDTIHLNLDHKFYENISCHSLEVFKAEGDHWSFAKTNGINDQVIEVAEKKRISDLCSNGLYYFNSVKSFTQAFKNMYLDLDQALWPTNETYVAPLFNHLIKTDQSVTAKNVNSSCIVPCGTPQEYYQLLDRFQSKESLITSFNL